MPEKPWPGIGAQDPESLRMTVRGVFNWSMVLTAAAIVLYASGTVPLVEFLSDDDIVTGAAGKYVLWLMVMPVLGCAAFAWDGIYIGAAAARSMRNAMLLSTVSFFLSFFIWTAAAGHNSDTFAGESAIHGLLFGYLVHLAVRVIYLHCRFGRDVLPLAGRKTDLPQDPDPLQK